MDMAYMQDVVDAIFDAEDEKAIAAYDPTTPYPFAEDVTAMLEPWRSVTCPVNAEHFDVIVEGSLLLSQNWGYLPRVAEASHIMEEVLGRQFEAFEYDMDAIRSADTVVLAYQDLADLVWAFSLVLTDAGHDPNAVQILVVLDAILMSFIEG